MHSAHAKDILCTVERYSRRTQQWTLLLSMCLSVCECLFDCVSASFDEFSVTLTYIHVDRTFIKAGPLTLYAIICSNADLLDIQMNK